MWKCKNLISVPRFINHHLNTCAPEFQLWRRIRSASLSHAEKCWMRAWCMLSSARHRSGHQLTQNLQPQPGRPINSKARTHIPCSHRLLYTVVKQCKPCSPGRAGGPAATLLVGLLLLPSSPWELSTGQLALVPLQASELRRRPCSVSLIHPCIRERDQRGTTVTQLDKNDRVQALYIMSSVCIDHYYHCTRCMKGERSIDVGHLLALHFFLYWDVYATRSPASWRGCRAVPCLVVLAGTVSPAVMAQTGLHIR